MSHYFFSPLTDLVYFPSYMQLRFFSQVMPNKGSADNCKNSMTSKSGIASKRFCVIYEGEVAIGETETGITGADAAVQNMSAKNPDRRYRRDEPTRYKKFFGDDLVERST